MLSANAEADPAPTALVCLTLRCSQEWLDTTSDALLEELDALSVSVEDADAGSAMEDALFGEPGMPPPRSGWQRSTVQALFDSDAAATRAATLLLAQPWAQHLHLISVQNVPATDWVRLTQSQFGPVEITPDFWVVPSWHEVPPQARHIIRLDPGLAFGTGTHPTTHMCLRWLASAAAGTLKGARVLDYGCGSGILAIAAGLLGAGPIDAVDIDEAAVQASRYNAQANGVTMQCADPAHAQGDYDVVLANILATPLRLLAPVLCAHLKPDGYLVLAGILERQADEIAAAYQPYVTLRVLDQQDGWILMGR